MGLKVLQCCTILGRDRVIRRVLLGSVQPLEGRDYCTAYHQRDPPDRDCQAHACLNRKSLQ